MLRASVSMARVRAINDEQQNDNLCDMHDHEDNGWDSQHPGYSQGSDDAVLRGGCGALEYGQ